MASVAILDAKTQSDRHKWLSTLAKWPDHEVYCHPDYVSLFAPKDGGALAAVIDAGDCGILYPFVLQPLSLEPWYEGDHCCDLTTPYGYGGPYRWGNPSSMQVATFWREVHQWLAEQRVVASFVRLSLFEDQMVTFDGHVKILATNVVRDLRDSPEAIWKDYAHKVRKNVKRARSLGVRIQKVESQSALSTFIDVYESTLRRRKARDWYYFSNEFFDQLLNKLQGYVAIFSAFHDDEVVASELILCSRRRIYSFLGGTTITGFEFRANDLLKHEIISWGQREGKDAFILGGGFEADDGIFRYKKGFAPTGEVLFRVGTAIHDEVAYSKLVGMRSRWESTSRPNWRPSGEFFPAYRQP